MQSAVSIFSSSNPPKRDFKDGDTFPSITIYCLPLLQSMGYSKLGKIKECKHHIDLELMDVAENIQGVWGSLGWTIYEDLYGFSKEFSKLLTKGFLFKLIDRYSDINEFTVVTSKEVEYLIDLFRVNLLLEGINIEVTGSFIDDCRSGLYPPHIILDNISVLRSKLPDKLKNNNFLKYVLEPKDVYEFVSNIRRNISKKHGYTFVSL